MQFVRPNVVLKCLLYTVLVAFACWFFRAQAHQAAQWRGAYFSMAANLTLTGRFLVDTTEINYFDKLPGDQQATYRFGRSAVSQPTEYTLMQIGYGYICALARRLWPFGGDAQAVILFQTVVHIGLCMWLLWLLPAGWRRLVFLLGYACNPVVVKYVTYDFYYFWQVIPSFLFIATYLGWRPAWWVGFWLGPLIGLLFICRPAMAGALAVLGALWWYQRQVGLLLLTAGLATCVIAFLYRPVLSAPWRPVYVGIAAYPNPYMNTLSDKAVYTLYKARTDLDYKYGDSEPAQEQRLTDVLQREVQTIWATSPLLFARHAVLNILLAFSTGYVTGGGPLNYGQALLGLLVLIGMLIARQYAIVLAVLATVGTFVLYYPPIPAYMYGAYLLLIMGFLVPTRNTSAA